MAKRKRKFHLLKSFTQYGFHIWAILIISNAALVYAFHFSTEAAQKQDVANIITATDTNTPSGEEIQQVATTIPPKGPVISLRFSVPGIGSGGGTLTPKRLQRNVTIFLYSTDADSENHSVKPLYTIDTTADYDGNTNSPTYTTFHNDFIDLGADVTDGRYQIAFRTDESLRTVIKDSPDKIGGKIVNLVRFNGPYEFPTQTVLMGDTIPKQGDNLIDISDYNSFLSCFGDRNNSTNFCSTGNYGDFNDDGVVDGIDYNILLRSFNALLQQGQPIPQITLEPTGPKRVSRLSNLASPTPIAKKQIATPTVPVKVTKTTASAGGLIGGFLFIIILGVLCFLFFKNEQFRNIVKGLIHLSPTGSPAATPPTEAEEETAIKQTTPPGASPEPPAPTETTDTTDAVPEATPDAEPETPVEPTPTPTDTPPAVDGEIERDCYIKKKLPDDAGTGFWLTLTDDNGALEAHYAKSDVNDGFAKVKGVMKTENGKTFLEISSITAEA